MQGSPVQRGQTNKEVGVGAQFAPIQSASQIDQRGAIGAQRGRVSQRDFFH